MRRQSSGKNSDDGDGCSGMNKKGRESLKQARYQSERVHKENTEKDEYPRKEKNVQNPSVKRTSCRANMDRATQTRGRVVNEEAEETPRHTNYTMGFIGLGK